MSIARSVRGRALPALLSVLLLAVAGCAGAGGTPSPAAASPSGSIAAAASASPTLAPAPTFPLSLTDDAGTAVTLTAVPHRVVSLTPAATETAFALGDGSRIVGVVQDVTPYPAAVKSLPVVATYQGADIEKIVGLRPDLVLAGGADFNKPSDIAKLRSLGIPVLVVSAKDVPGVLADVALEATALGESARGAELAASMQARMDAITAAASASGPKPRVFYELDATNQLFGPAPDSFVTGLITAGGGDPITSGQAGVYSISLEKLVAADPQVIVLGDADYGATAAQVAKRPGWEGMSAVKDGAIRPVDDTVVTRPGPRLPDGLRDLALAIHPDLQLPSAAPAPTWTSPSTP